MSQMLNENLSVAPMRSFYVRGRNVLLARGKFGPLFMDYYLHLMQHSIRQEESMDDMLKDLLAALTLHLCSRPQDEGSAWTVNLHRPLMNLFAAGTTRPGRVTGRVFTEDVKDSGKNLFIAQQTRPHHPPRQSLVEFEGVDMLRAVELFYDQSEQRLARLFRGDDEEYFMLSAEPDCDEEWLRGLAQEDIMTLDEREHLVPLETRAYVFECGCSIEKLYPLLARLQDDDIEAVFGDGFARITCPRCGAVFNTPRAHFEEWQDTQAKHP
jgi:molecular chaperone Hsp33